MGQPDPGALTELARMWLRGVTTAGFVPGPRARARHALEDLLREIITAVQAEPFDPAEGRRIGAELVSLRMSAPEVLGTTVRLLGEGLPPLLGEGLPPQLGEGLPPQLGAAGRVLRLLGELSTGFATEQRRAAVAAAEQINSAYRKHLYAESVRMQAELRHTALHDPRTGLPNRAALSEHLTRPYRGRLGICLVGIDRFADINDALGHEHGVRLLREAAARLGALGGDFLAHTADDHFTLVLTDTTSADEVVKVADLAIRTLRSPVVIDGFDLRLPATAGVVEGPADGARVDGWLRDAHLALQGARRDRREIGVFDPARATADLQRHRLAAAMPAALERGEFVPHFQPLYRLSDRRIVGVEALARWRRPTGVLGPRHFITLAEHTGLIHPLGRHLLAAACRQAAAWRLRRPELLLSVNLSPWQLSEPGLLADIETTLRATGLPARNLQLEITESAAVDDHHDALRGLAALGIRLAIDDLGTGHSAIADLPTLPITGVKLAAELLPHDAGDHTRRTVLRSLVDLCHALGITVTGEGIETPDHERLLHDLDCDNGQGFLYARPAPADAITRMLAR
jgi:diguanylate cyclase (GGDEF)-like protein